MIQNRSPKWLRVGRLFVFCFAGLCVLVPAAFAESPPCRCQMLSVTVKTTPPAPCLTIDTADVEACSGGHAQWRVLNRCTKPVVIRGTRNINDGPPEQTVAPNSDGSYSEVFQEPVLPGQSRPIQILRTMSIGTTRHRVELNGEVQCSAPKKTKSSGCSFTASRGAPSQLAVLLLLCLVGRRPIRK